MRPIEWRAVCARGGVAAVELVFDGLEVNAGGADIALFAMSAINRAHCICKTPASQRLEVVVALVQVFALHHQRVVVVGPHRR